MSYWSRQKREAKFNFMFIAFVLTVPALAKLGLSVRFPDFVMEKVEPGVIFNLRKDRGVPYVVINSSDKEAEVQVDVDAPSAKTLMEGYEPIPNPEWFKVIPNKFKLGPGELAAADVVMSVPNDPALVGRHFQVHLRARTLGTGFMAVAVKNVLRFSVGSLGPEALKQEKALQTLQNLDLDVTPQSMYLTGVPLGKDVDVAKARGASLKVTNRGGEVVKLKLYSAPVDVNLRHQQYEPAPDPKWLSVKPAVLKVKPNRIAEAKMTICIPDAPEHRGRKYMFLVKAELDGLGIPLELHSRVFVETEGESVKTE